MLKTFFDRLSVRSAPALNQRQIVEKALADLNEVLGAMADRPALTIDMASGRLAIDLPDQMPDEALALPAPEAADTPQVEKDAA